MIRNQGLTPSETLIEAFVVFQKFKAPHKVKP